MAARLLTDLRAAGLRVAARKPAQSFGIEDLVSELHWPAAEAVDVGLVETAGGVRSPLAVDGDCLALCEALAPDVVVLVSDAGLGTINAVRLTLDALHSVAAPAVVVLNRFDAALDLHVRNREWLRARDACTVVVVPGGERELAAFVAGRG